MSNLLDRWFPTSRGYVKCDPKREKYERQKSTDGERIEACKEILIEAFQNLQIDKYTQDEIYERAVKEAEGRPNQELAQSYLHRLRTRQRQ